MLPTRPLAAVLAAASLCACQVARPSELPRNEAWLVAVKSAGIPESMPWYSRFAEHTWVDVKCGSEDAWKRAEVLGSFTGATYSPISEHEAHRDFRWSHEAVRVHELIRGERAQRIAARIAVLTEHANARYADGGYEAWPGPNSNTFIRDLTHELPELAFVFDHNALGKDYAWIAAGLTPSRTGVHLDTWPLGVAVGAREGIELHVLQLTLGVRFWPPRLELPFLPPLPWESAPDEPPAANDRPEVAQHSLIYSPNGNGRSWMRSACAPELRAGEVVLVSTVDGDAWISMRVERVAPSVAAPLGRLDAEVVIRGSERTAIEREVPFDAERKAVLGPFDNADARVSLEVELGADDKLHAMIVLEQGGK